MKHPSLPHLLQVALFGGAIATTTTLSFLSPVLSPAVNAALEDSPKALLDEAWQIVNREYVDTTFNRVDWQQVRQELLGREYTSREEAYTALRESLERLEDPYTRFLDPRQYRALTSQTSGELSGIGIRLRLDDNTQSLTVVEPIQNSPAMVAGVQAGDRILAIDGKPTQGMTVDEASELIRGEIGTRITLRIDRTGTGAFDLPLTRERIQLRTVNYALKREGNVQVGYIRLAEFSGHASEQMQQAIEELTKQGAEAFVLDLRGNPGGLLQASIDISRMWMEQGAIVRTVDRAGNSKETTANHTALTNLPLAVLVNGNSASSSEILTGALMDNQRATIVGSRTFGKALVQSVHALSDGSGLAVTIAHYYTPGGTDISHRGITPHVQIDLTDQQRQQLTSNPNLLATPSDPQYAGAVDSLRQSVLANRTLPSQNQQVSERSPETTMDANRRAYQ
ncbi:PDZ domain-containing protein [Oculatella sp. LEGE 06141]|uniref:carboxyl-terminal processing protease CtpB n=1 Tax=Oculatella sp. LEGE 06141 TaxID=1828648 RepID=UPI001880410D|nr:carboxyl-terminal processing protease CtpB [Oculatella sp. LEGE 06141]MBE9177912.1 PDZ domain-containing protein [Oculatella sp. LEGE 06141]